MPAIKIGKAKKPQTRFISSPTSEIPSICQLLESKGMRSDLLVTCKITSVARLTSEVQLQDDKKGKKKITYFIYSLLKQSPEGFILQSPNKKP